MNIFRNYETDSRGNNFDERTIILVWNKAARGIVQKRRDMISNSIIPDKNELRKDAYGNHIRYGDYGNTSSLLGWEIDHIRPIIKGGTAHLTNLQPLQWQQKRKKAITDKKVERLKY